MLVRQHRQLLSDSMETVKEIENTPTSLIEHINGVFKEWGKVFTVKDVKVEFYAKDERIDWDCYIIILKDYGVFGFCNEMVNNPH